MRLHNEAQINFNFNYNFPLIIYTTTEDKHLLKRFLITNNEESLLFDIRALSNCLLRVTAGTRIVR